MCLRFYVVLEPNSHRENERRHGNIPRIVFSPCCVVRHKTTRRRGHDRRLWHRFHHSHRPAESRISRELTRITDYVNEKLRRRKKSYITVDLTDKLEELSPAGYRKHIMWLHCGFYITNFTSPCAVLYYNTFCICWVIFPCGLLGAVPYRIYMRFRCTDEKIYLDCRLVLKMTYTVLLVLHCFSADRHFPSW